MVMAEAHLIALDVLDLDCVHFTDDWFFAAPTQEACQTRLDQLQHLLAQLGFAINSSKTEGPAQVLTFLGVSIDSVQMLLSLPQHKVQSTVHKLEALQASQEPWRRRDMESLLGKLEWAASVMIAGRAHLKRIWYCLPRNTWRNAPVHLTSAALSELAWWRNALSTSGGFHWSPIWQGQLPVRARVLSDASGAVGGGFGLLCNGHIVQGRFEPPPPQIRYSSSYLELAPVLWAVQTLAPQLAGSILVITSDNLGNVFALNKGTCRGEQAFSLLHEIFDIAAKHRIYIIADWIPREHNTFTDRLSKWQLFQRPA
jgi:hypothetical protein